MHVVSRATDLPFQIDDAGRSEAEATATGLPVVNQDTALNFRYVYVSLLFFIMTYILSDITTPFLWDVRTIYLWCLYLLFMMLVRTSRSLRNSFDRYWYFSNLFHQDIYICYLSRKYDSFPFTADLSLLHFPSFLIFYDLCFSTSEWNSHMSVP